MIKKFLARLRGILADDKFKKDVSQDLQLIVVAVIGIALLLFFISVGGAGGAAQKESFKSSPPFNERGVR